MDHSLLVSAATFTPALGLIISGGFDSSGIDSSRVVHTIDGLTFKELSPLPVTLRGHCMVALGDKSLFVTGGLQNNWNNHSSKTYVYESNKWYSKPRLPTPRGGVCVNSML